MYIVHKKNVKLKFTINLKDLDENIESKLTNWRSSIKLALLKPRLTVPRTRKDQVPFAELKSDKCGGYATGRVRKDDLPVRFTIRAHIHSQNLMPVATIKVHEKPVVERREKERERSRKMILLRDAAMSCISEKNYGPRERSQIVEIIRCDSLLSFSCWLRQRSRLSTTASKKRPGREIMHAVVQNSADTRHGSLACLISQRYETREISELSTNLIKTVRVWIVLPDRYFTPTSLFIMF